MAYLPKSKYTVSSVGPGKFTTEDGEPYVGPVITTYKTESFAGSSPDSLDIPLIPVKLSESIELKVVPGKRVPTEEEYRNGCMERYFRQDLRTMKVIELTVENYSRSLQEDRPSYYTYASASWLLTGSLDDYFIGTYRCMGVRKLNQLTINEMDRILPGIVSSQILEDPAQFVKNSI